MQRPFYSTQRKTTRRPNGPSSSSPSFAGTSSAPATMSAWVHPRLLSTTAQLLTLRPDDPLRVLRTRFATEAFLLAAYPKTAAAADEKELEEEEGLAASRRGSLSSAGPSGKGTTGGLSRGKALSGRGDARAATALLAQQQQQQQQQQQPELLIEHNWARRRLQPYGLHAMARSVCPPSDPPLDSATAADASAAAIHAVVQQQQWMECFALLHRQSRLSAAERAAASQRAVQVSGAALPPVDYRAVEEVPVPLAVLYLISVVEENTRRGGGGAEVCDASPACVAFVFRRSQLSVKLLALQLLAAVMRRQEHDQSERCSSPSEFSGTPKESLVCDVEEGAKENPGAVGATTSDRSDGALSLLHSLRPHELEELHHWLLQRLREVSICPAVFLRDRVESPSTVGRASPAVEGNSAADAVAPSTLRALQSSVMDAFGAIFCRCSTASPEVTAAVSVDSFVTLMKGVASILVAHQSTTVSMAATLSARVARSPYGVDERSAASLRWVKALLERCTVRLIDSVSLQPQEPTPNPSSLPPLWAMYMRQVISAVAALQPTAVQRGESAVILPTAGSSARLALSKLLGDARSEDCACLTAMTHAFKNVTGYAIVTVVVNDWVSRIFEAYILSMSDSLQEAE